jgi:hypothetical protein
MMKTSSRKAWDTIEQFGCQKGQNRSGCGYISRIVEGGESTEGRAGLKRKKAQHHRNGAALFR